MSLTQQQAAEALEEIASTERQVAMSNGYRTGSPHFLLWGVIWTLGYEASYLYPEQTQWIWVALDLIGAAGGMILARKANPAPGAANRESWRFMGAFLVVGAFIGAVYYIFAPHTLAQFGALPPLVLALIYTWMGLFNGPRLLLTGGTLLVLTLVGYVFLLPWFLPWIGFAGGGTLVLTGLWLRRA